MADISVCHMQTLMSANATNRVNLTKRTMMQYKATRTLED